MPVEVGIWRISGENAAEPIEFSRLGHEKRLEEAILEQPNIVDSRMLVLGSQVPTDHGKYIDILGINPGGDLLVYELKRDRTPREVVAQILDYASWVESLGYDEVCEIFESNNSGKLEAAFAERFDESPPEELNADRDLTIVASELDAATERIITYLADNFGVPINAVYFRHFEENGEEYFARTWLIDPAQVRRESSKGRKRKRETWNGRDYYVSFGEDARRRWEDARRFGFVSGGGKRWHSRTLEMLSPGDRVFVNIPKTGYVGVGEVVEGALPVTEFEVSSNSGETKNILDMPLAADRMGESAGDPEEQEYLVRVDWQDTKNPEHAVWEKGMFANQNTVCKMRSSFTIETLERRFDLSD